MVLHSTGNLVPKKDNLGGKGGCAKAARKPRNPNARIISLSSAFALGFAFLAASSAPQDLPFVLALSNIKFVPETNWPVGLMDKASASGAGDSRFESWAGHCVTFSQIHDFQ